MLKISENNGTEEFGLVTPTPGLDCSFRMIFVDQMTSSKMTNEISRNLVAVTMSAHLSYAMQ